MANAVVSSSSADAERIWSGTGVAVGCRAQAFSDCDSLLFTVGRRRAVTEPLRAQVLQNVVCEDSARIALPGRQEVTPERVGGCFY